MQAAAKYGYLRVVKYLLDRGATRSYPVDEFGNEENTPLHYAVVNRHYEVSRTLIEGGAPLDTGLYDEGETPLFFAVYYDDLRIARLLLESGAMAYSPYHRENLLVCAARNNNVQMIHLLLNHGAEIGCEYSRSLVDNLKNEAAKVLLSRIAKNTERKTQN